MLKSYIGEKPYVFVSYSHKDWDRVSFIIKKLQDNLCHIWYDEGIKSGRIWDENLAESLFNSEVVLLFLSPSSIESEYVKKEIKFACKHNKQILPVYLDNVDLPIDLDFQLSVIQAIAIYGMDEKSTIKKIIDGLPEKVFLHTESPFHIDDSYSFYLRVKEHFVKAGINDKDVLGFQIYRTKNDRLDEEVLFEFCPTAAYDNAIYTVTLCEKIRDQYFNECENGIVVFNLDAKFFLSYPLTGADFVALMTFIIVNPNGEKASVKLVDSKFKTTNHDYDKNISVKSLKEELWGSGTEISMIENKKS